MSPRTVKVAAVQAAPVGYDLPASLDKVSALVSTAAREGAQLVVLPEAFLSAYPRHWGGFSIGSRTHEQRDWYGRYVRSSVRVPEDAVGYDWAATGQSVGDAESHASADDFAAFRRLCGIARDNKVYLSIGIVERSLIGSTLYCTNLLFSPRGVLLAKHRKLQPTAAERVVWGQGEATYPVSSSKAVTAHTGAGNGAESSAEERDARDKAGDNMPVVRTAVGNVGGLICWENYMPLSRYVLYQKGVEIYTAPTADARPTWLPTMQHIAQEGRCYVISANQYHAAPDFPSDYPTSSALPTAPAPAQAGGVDDKAPAWSRGGSSIVGPLGEVLAGPLWDEEGTLYATLDLDALDGARLDFDPVGHYAREELLLGLIAGGAGAGAKS